MNATNSRARRLVAHATLELLRAELDEFDDPCDAPTGALPLDQAPTAALPAVASKLDRGCRTKLADGKRCGHATAAHQRVGFNDRERCFCGCTAYRQPWFDFVLTAGAVVIVVVLLFLLLMAAS